jgi:hypothetical protein
MKTLSLPRRMQSIPRGRPILWKEVQGTSARGHFTLLLPAGGQPDWPPWRLALVTMMPLRENHADRQAAEAVRARIDWKYRLGLALTAPGCD